MREIKKLVWVVALILAGGAGFAFILKQRARVAEHELASLLPQIASITLYDIQGDNITAAPVSTASASFPLEVFTRAARSASSGGKVTIWKGSSLALLTLKDGTQRRSRFSYYGGFFTLDGVGRAFTIRGEAASEFQQTLSRLIQEQFVPKRQKQNAMPNQSAQATRDSGFCSAFADGVDWPRVPGFGRWAEQLWIPDE